MIELRLYRAAFLPALLALIVAMFSLQDRPQGIPQALAADVLFQGKAAAATIGQIVAQTPIAVPARSATSGRRTSWPTALPRAGSRP